MQFKTSILLFMLLILLGAASLFSTTIANADRLRGSVSTLIINEVDADTPGSDIAEFAELFDGGVGNTPLDGYVLIFFNGSNDQSYLAIDLDGYSTDANGYFVIGNSAVASVAITIADNSLQQGADAVALYQASAVDFPNGTAVTTANLIDALVYDTNDADDAELLALLNIGQPQVNEGGAGSSADHSNQRCTNGSGGQRNTSTFVQLPPSPGAVNNCDALAPTATPTPANTPITPTPTSSITPETGLVINEVDVDTPSSDTAEFIELFDGGSGNTPLDGLAIVFFDGSSDESYLALDLDGLTTNADGYFVAGNPAVASAVITFADGRLQNGADAVALYVGSASDFPANTPVTTTNLLDAIVYGTDDADDAGLLTLLLAGEGQMNEAGARNSDAVAMGRCPNGSGGQRVSSTLALISPSPNEPNNCGSPLPTLTATPTSSEPTAIPSATATATSVNATPSSTPVVASVLINEVDADSVGADVAEFIELVGAPGTALDGLCLVAVNGSNDRVYLNIDLAGATLSGSGYYVIGNAGVANVGWTFADNALQNGPDAVAVVAAGDCGTALSSSTTVTDLLSMTLVDALVYGTNDDDDIELLALLNPGQPQVNEDGSGDSSIHANARCADGSGGARNSSSFAQVPPSPGRANECGTVPTATPTVTPSAIATTAAATPTPTGTPFIPTPTATATTFVEPIATATATPTATPQSPVTTVTPTATIDPRVNNSVHIYLPVIQR